MRCRTLTSRAGRFRAAQVLGALRAHLRENVPRWADAGPRADARASLGASRPLGGRDFGAGLIFYTVSRPGAPARSPRSARAARRAMSRHAGRHRSQPRALRSVRKLSGCAHRLLSGGARPIAPARAAAAARHPGKRGWHCPAAPRNAQCPRRRGLMPGSFHNIPGRPPVGRGASHWGEARRDTVHCGLRQLCYAART